MLPNVRIMEIDIDDVPWKGTLVTKPPVIRDGHIWLGDAPGWGADIDERARRAPVAAARRQGHTTVLWDGPSTNDGAALARHKEKLAC